MRAMPAVLATVVVVVHVLAASANTEKATPAVAFDLREESIVVAPAPTCQSNVVLDYPNEAIHETDFHNHFRVVDSNSFY